MAGFSIKRSLKNPADMANEELLAELEALGLEITSGRAPRQEKVGERYREVRARILFLMRTP